MTNQTNPIEVYRSPTECIRLDAEWATGVLDGKRFVIKLNPQNVLATCFRWHKNKNPLTTPPLSNEGAQKLLNTILKRIPDTPELAEHKNRFLNIQRILNERISYLKEGYHNISEGNKTERETLEKKKAIQETQRKVEYAEKTAQRKAQKEALKKDRQEREIQEKEKRSNKNRQVSRCGENVSQEPRNL